ncbi:MAG: D-alanyl-D-alanine carboxypeptidase/D-alanyl-D-alanine-endopeptidase [Myxococcota bacterium]
MSIPQADRAGLAAPARRTGALAAAAWLRRSAVRVLALALLAWVPLAAGGAAAADDVAARGRDAALRAALERSLDVQALRGARVAALVEGADGRVVFARDADRPLTPASNAKIFTSLAALSAFGPAHRFETLLLADREPDAEGAVGTLVLKGGGDPALNSEDWWRIADGLRRAGLRRVRGDLVLDDSLFDRELWHPSWGRTSARAYHAPVSALNANYGTFSAVVRPGAAIGSPAIVSLAPAVDHLRLVNRAVTLDPRRQTQLRVDREEAAGNELVIVSGQAAADEHDVTFYRSVVDPTRYAGSVLREQLAQAGVRVDGELRVARDGAEAAGTELLRHRGRPLSEIVELCMKYSNNQIAEALVKQLALREGAPRGSWSEGIPALRRRLESLGVGADGFDLVDGSGLSYHDRATPRALVQAIRAGESSFAFGPEWMASMPIADVDGTLSDRAAGAAGWVRAKTGTLTRVTALSGLAQLASGERVRFSILVNGYRSGDRDAMRAVDGFVEALVSPPSVAAGGR